MALPDYAKLAQGTAVIWGEAGATGIGLTVTKTLTFEALAAGAARMGVYADLGALWDQEYSLQLIIETGTAPTAGDACSVFLAWSFDTTNFSAGVTGADAAYAAGAVAATIKNLGVPRARVIATNNANTVLRGDIVSVRPRARYVVPVVYNQWDAAIRDETTATDNDSRVVLMPIVQSIED